MYGVEPNPGPGTCKKTNLAIRIYNCNGLVDTNKLRRVLAKSRNEVSNGGIVLLQETHIKDET